MFDKIPNWFKNKYVLTILSFSIWILFFDQNNLITQYKYRTKLNSLLEDKQFYAKEIKTTQAELKELTTNPKTLEKFAREKYFMKKDNETIFVFVEED